MLGSRRAATGGYACPFFAFALTIFRCRAQVAALRRELGAEAALRRRQLPLWTPPLEVPFPPLQPAIFPPAFRELPPPALELFDLEEELAGPLVRHGHKPGGVGGWLQKHALMRGCHGCRQGKLWLHRTQHLIKPFVAASGSHQAPPRLCARCRSA
jgi:hypothetical protein